MKYGKSVMPMLLASVLVFVGTLAINTPTCLGWFYEPKKPEGL
ncbi:cyclic lactone autoinducer peptide [Desulfosporosinus shakirovi]|nr:cyclic lactone autoinducer peptide [Desulfosporosinus sp. SRJS8]MCB8817578.1 cyclic lactone autoinducer peptide [Desulfosporosinus sp. SRJS8]